MDLKDIKAIIDLMKKNSVSEFELEKQDFKIRLNNSIFESMKTSLFLNCALFRWAYLRPMAKCD